MTQKLERRALAATICTVAATMAWLIVGIAEWVGAPFPGFLVLKNGVVASAGLTHWPAIADGTIFQAKVQSYDGIALSDSTTFNAYVASKPIGSSIEYTFESRNEIFARTIPTRRFQSSDAFLLFGVTLFSAIALLSVSLALIYIAPKDPASIGCAIALAITGLFALTAVDLYGPYRFFRLHAFAESFLGAGGIHMSLVFPHQRRIYRDNRWILAAAYAVSASIAVLNQLSLYHPSGYTFTHLLAMAWAGIAFSIMAFSQIEAFFRPANYEARQRVSILAIGTFASITPAVLIAIGSSITGGEAPENLISWTGAFFPLAVGYAVLKSDLLEVDAVLRRTVNYVLLTIAVASVYTAFLTITEWLVRDSSNTSRTISTIVFAALFSFAILPVRDRVQSWVDQTFFRSAYDFRITIEDASNRLARLIELDRIRDRITTTIRDTLNPETIELAIIPEDEQDQYCAIDLGTGSAEPIDLESGGLEVRFQSRDRVVGRLMLGRKLSGRFYSGLDRGLLKVLANQGSIAIENALAVDRLQEMNRTLEIRVKERTAELASALEDLTSTQAQLLQAERLAAVGELAAGVAHEVNNPLNFARNSLRALQSLVAELVEYAQEIATLNPKDEINFRSNLERLLSRHTPTNVNELAEDIKQLAEILGSGLDRTARLVQDLRDFSTPKRASRAPYSFSHLVIEAIDLTGSTIREKGIEIRFAGIPQEPTLVGDSQAIAQVILNILKNSVDALDGCTAGRIEICMSLLNSPNLLVIEFQDNGPGVGEEDLQHIFEPFFSTKAAGKGTGLGLALCKRVIQEHHGQIQVTSTQNVGATVRIALPVEDRDESRAALSQLSHTS